MAGPTIDPIKVVKKYFIVFVASAVFGLVFGVGAYFVLGRVAPLYRSTVIFGATPPPSDPTRVTTDRFDNDELEAFIATQRANIVSDGVLQSVVNDNRILQGEAGQWSKRFEGDLGGIDQRSAVVALQEMIKTRALEGTQLFTVSVEHKDPAVATALLGLIRQNYMSRLAARGANRQSERLESLRSFAQDREREIEEQSDRRARIMREQQVESTREGGDNATADLRNVNSDILEKQSELVAAQEDAQSMEEALEAAPEMGLQVPGWMSQEVESSGPIFRLTQQLEGLRTNLSTLRLDLGPEHRQVRLVESSIAATEQEMDRVRESETLRLFNATLDSRYRQIAQLEAQLDELEAKAAALGDELNDLSQTLAELADIEDRIKVLSQGLLETESTILAIQAQQNSRVFVQDPERRPDRREFPQPIPVVGASFVIFMGLTVTLAFARETLDQRVKGASDVAMIPRTRVLGVVPLAAEDPTNPKHFETIFRDQPRGVLSEAFRQLRTSVLKDMSAKGAKSLMVVSASPGSGSTSVITNLAFAAASVNKRVLIIDANYRRPSLHTVFGLEAGPGLSDVLNNNVEPVDAVHQEVEPLVDVLTAGSVDNRVYEHLGTGPMANLLADAAGAYDLLLIDVAPAVVAGDAVALTNQVDALVLVARALSEKRGMVARLKRELSDGRAALLGVLVNAVRGSAGGYMRQNIRQAHKYQAQAEQSRNASVDDKPKPTGDAA